MKKFYLFFSMLASFLVAQNSEAVSQDGSMLSQELSAYNRFEPTGAPGGIQGHLGLGDISNPMPSQPMVPQFQGSEGFAGNIEPNNAPIGGPGGSELGGGDPTCAEEPMNDCYCLYRRWHPCYYYKCRCEYIPQYSYTKCCRYVPQYYQVQCCRYVPQYYCKTCCRQCPQYYYTCNCHYCPKYCYDRCCKFTPEYYYKHTCGPTCCQQPGMGQ
jgi:hypothetical protein